MIWAPALMWTAAGLAVLALVAAGRSRSTGNTTVGCAGLLSALAALWTTVAACVCLFAGV